MRERAATTAGGERRALGADAHVEHAAGAEGDLGHARRRRRPGRRARTAGHRRARRSAERRAARWPHRSTPVESTTRRDHRLRDAQSLQQRAGRAARHPGPAAPRSRRSTGPRRGGRPRSGSTRATSRACRSTGRAAGRGRWRSSRCDTLVADRFGARRKPSPLSTRQSPTVRRSCQPSAGPTGSPVARSHTTVEARWLLIPTARTGPSSSPWRSRVSRAHSIAARTYEVASNSTRPGIGTVGQGRTVDLVMDRGIGCHDRGADAAGACVDDQDRHCQPPPSRLAPGPFCCCHRRANMPPSMPQVAISSARNG